MSNEEKKELMQKMLEKISNDYETVNVQMVSKLKTHMSYLGNAEHIQQELENNQILIVTYSRKNIPCQKVSYDVELGALNASNTLEAAEDVIKMVRHHYGIAFGKQYLDSSTIYVILKKECGLLNVNGYLRTKDDAQAYCNLMNEELPYKNKAYGDAYYYKEVRERIINYK